MQPEVWAGVKRNRMGKKRGVFPVTLFLKNRIHQRAFPRVFQLPLGKALAKENDLVLSAYMPQISQRCIPDYTAPKLQPQLLAFTASNPVDTES